MSDSIPWGPTGPVVYERTYSRTKDDGTRETWPETVARVVDGNLALIHGLNTEAWSAEARAERERLRYHMERFAVIPGGRHLWASGVEGRQYLFNCHVAGWGDKLSDHFEFSALRLFEGGGVGANYSTKHIAKYGFPHRHVNVHIVCDPAHQDIDELRPFLSEKYTHDGPGMAIQVYIVGDSREGWADALSCLIDLAMGDDKYDEDDLVFEVSWVRPSGSQLKSSGGTASGPAPLAKMLLDTAAILSNARSIGRLTPLHVMEIDHAIAEAVVAGGNRRSARMAIVHWNDDYVGDFITCKGDTGKHWTTNISVEVDDEFFAQLKDPGSWASEVHKLVVNCMLANGEPGYWNRSLSQEGEVGEVIATNPCLTGDTVIATVNGPRTFADLAEVGEDVLVYSWHPKTKKPVIRWMRRPHRTAINAAILKVTFDSGLVVRCTPTHGFYSFRGEKIEAADLRPGQSIRAFSASRDSSGHERVHGWDSQRNAADHQWTHRMLWENKLGIDELPEGINVAHLDGDGSNNDIHNLALMTELGHRRYDMPVRQAAGMDGHCANHKVVSVERDGYEDVYNGMVEDSHTYIVLDPDPVAGHMSGVVSANCGEIALESWENCNLGHVNLDAFAPKVKGEKPDFGSMIEAHRLITRFLVRATYGDVNDPKQAVALARNRRIGVGHLGVQGFWAKLGVKYSDIPKTGAPYVLEDLYSVVREAAGKYAFQLRIPEPVKVTCVAPTGTIAKLPGVSEGIHPIYARHFERRVRFSMRDDNQFAQVADAQSIGFEIEDDIYDQSGMTKVVVFPTEDILVAQVRAMGWPDDVVESAEEITPRAMLAVQEMYQRDWADNAVSYTVNLPAGAVSAGELRDMLAEYLPSLKGTTIMVDASRPQAPYTRITEEQYRAARAKNIEDSTSEECSSGACPVK